MEQKDSPRYQVTPIHVTALDRQQVQWNGVTREGIHRDDVEPWHIATGQLALELHRASPNTTSVFALESFKYENQERATPTTIGLIS